MKKESLLPQKVNTSIIYSRLIIIRYITTSPTFGRVPLFSIRTLFVVVLYIYYSSQFLYHRVLISSVSAYGICFEDLSFL